jgi:hypothetical protein
LRVAGLGSALIAPVAPAVQIAKKTVNRRVIVMVCFFSICLSFSRRGA